MALREWVRLPSKWIEDGGLKQLSWVGAGTRGSDNIAALMVLIAIAHHADDAGLAKLPYDQLCAITGLSRAKVADGLDVLAKISVIQRAFNGRSTYQLVNYDANGGWAKLPVRKLHHSGRIVAFDDFKLRSITELNALKLYLLFAARRDNYSNMASIGYEKINEYSGVDRNRIKAAVSLLATHQLVVVEYAISSINSYGISNSYRLSHLETRNHMGTRGRGMDLWAQD